MFALDDPDSHVVQDYQELCGSLWSKASAFRHGCVLMMEQVLLEGVEWLASGL